MDFSTKNLKEIRESIVKQLKSFNEPDNGNVYYHMEVIVELLDYILIERIRSNWGKEKDELVKFIVKE